MDAEEILATCFPDLNVQPAAELEPCTNKPHSPKASSPAEACFDCNICLDYSTNPVITLCGHLYCWPCIFRWLHLDAAIPGHCPVCKSPLSESSLVPLYGCGLEAKPDHQDENIPERPRDHRNFTAAAAALDPNLPLSPRQHVQVHQNYYNDDRDIHRGILPFAILPGAFRNHRDSYSNLNQTSAMMTAGGSLSRRQELIENWLHQLWIFLVCCAFLCLIFF